MALSRAEALALDATDPLASFRDRFVIDDPLRDLVGHGEHRLVDPHRPWVT